MKQNQRTLRVKQLNDENSFCGQSTLLISLQNRVFLQARWAFMKSRITVLLLVGFLACFGSVAHSASKPPITLQQLQDMFAQMKANTPWNVDGPLLWGYFFTDPDPNKLKPIATKLVDEGYRLVNIYPGDDKRTFWLHVEKVERHTPVSLNVRNQEFYRLAKQFGIQSYDGMDVGPAQ